MDSLNITSPPLKLPASAFPSRADVYECDKCGRDVTKHFRVGRAHVWKPMGPERYQCGCGQKYLTGATEWDHLGDWERKRRVRQSFGLGVLFSALGSGIGLVVYAYLRFGFGLHRGALVTGLIIAACPFLLMNIPFWLGVIMSIWRTRVGNSTVSD
jgi:hypothetical protein